MRLVFRLFMSLLAVLGLLVMALASLWWWFEPDDYRERLAFELSEVIGQPVDITGPVSVALWPRPVLELEAVQVANVDGYEEPLLAQASGLRVGVALLPLLHGVLRLDQVRVERLAIQLERDDSGDGNWERLAASLAGDGTDQEARLRFDGVDRLRAALLELAWRDAGRAGRGGFTISNLHMDGLRRDHSGRLRAEWRVAWDQVGGAEGSLGVGFRLDEQFRPADLHLEDWQARLVPRHVDDAHLPLRLDAELSLDLPAREATLQAFRLVSDSLSMEVQADAQWAEGILDVTGWYAVADDAFRDTLRKIIGTDPDTEDPDSMQRLRAEGMFKYRNGRLGLGDVTLRLDDSQLTATASYSRQSVPVLEFEAALDYILVDRYTPEEVDPDTIRAVLTSLLQLAHGLHVDGELTIQALETNGLQFRDISAHYLSDGQLLQINPLQAEAYGGSYRGTWEIPLGVEPYRFRFDQRVEGLALREPLEALFGWAVLDSRVETRWEGAFTGMYWAQIRDSLEASGELNFRDGRINRFSLKRLIEDAVPSTLGGADTEPFEDEASTAFSTLGGSLYVADGVLSNPEARARSGHFAVRGAGELDLRGMELDYGLELTILRTFETESEQLLELLRGLTFPLRLRGPLTDLDLDLDPSQLAEDVQENGDEAVD